MDKKDVKKAFESAENELKEKQINRVKEIVKKTLEKLESLKEDKRDVDERIRYLKMDLDDLKEGHLDRIEERQRKDEKAKDASVIIIIKEKEIIREHTYPSPWYQPYIVKWNYELPCNVPTFYTSNGTGGNGLIADSIDDNSGLGEAIGGSTFTINSSVAKNASIGSYEIGDKVIHFR